MFAVVLEAAGQLPKEKGRFVRHTIRRINYLIVIKVENSFVMQPVYKGGALPKRQYYLFGAIN